MIYEVRNLTFSYPQSQRQILVGANLTLKKGEILCILGPNGAGKTTLLNCMAGLLSPQKGSVTLCGKDMSKLTPAEVSRLCAYVPQLHTPAFDYRVLDFVMMGRTPNMGALQKPKASDESFCMKVMEEMGIGHLANKSYINLSGGERQQLLIARAIVQEPEVILFDEPTAHLDYGNQQRVLMRVKEMSQEGYSIIITTHNPDHALLLGGRVAIVDRNGEITQGTCEEMITEDRLSSIYHIKTKLLWVEELGRTVCLVPRLEGTLECER